MRPIHFECASDEENSCCGHHPGLGQGWTAKGFEGPSQGLRETVLRFWPLNGIEATFKELYKAIEISFIGFLKSFIRPFKNLFRFVESLVEAFASLFESL